MAASWLISPVMSGALHTLHPTPYTLHPTPYTLNPAPYTLHPSSFTLHPATRTLHPTTYTQHPAAYTLHPTPFTPGCCPERGDHTGQHPSALRCRGTSLIRNQASLGPYTMTLPRTLW